MAQLSRAHPLNTEGPVYVDTTCINCGTCYHLAAGVFSETRDQSVVVNQPDSPDEWEQTKRAVISCPTSSIGVNQPPEEFKKANLNLPLLIEEDVFYCGFTSKDSFGASSYLIKRNRGNVLIDSPRFNSLPVKEIEELGGAEFMILTHKDDVADHEKFAKHFQLKRVIHQDEVTSDTKDCEIILRNSSILNLDEDIAIQPVPGHTKGHIAIYYRNKFLFTGDHIFVEGDALVASRNVCWYSWNEQIRSTKLLAGLKFEWVMPGHGGWGHFSEKQLSLRLKNLIADMEAQSA